MQWLRLVSGAVAAAAAVAGLTACGLTKSPAEDVNFTAPQSWGSTPGIMGRFQMWTSPGAGDKQILMLLKLPADAKVDESFDADDVRKMSGQDAVRDTSVVEHKKMTLCGDHASQYMKLRGVSGKDKRPQLIDAVVSKAPDGTYMAMHIYPLGTTPDAAADAAIYELCPRR